MMLTIVPLFSFPCHLTNIPVLNGPFSENIFYLRLINSVNFHITHAQIRYSVVWNSTLMFVMGRIT